MKRAHLLLFLLSTFSVLEAAPEITRPRPHPEAEKAMAGFDLERDFSPSSNFIRARS